MSLSENPIVSYFFPLTVLAVGAMLCEKSTLCRMAVLISRARSARARNTLVKSLLYCMPCNHYKSYFECVIENKITVRVLKM